jgi:hypothetical protein
MRQQTRTESWLQKVARKSTYQYLFGGLGLVLLAAVVLLVTYWGIYFVIYFGFGWLFPHSHGTRMWTIALVLGLVFVGNALVDRHYLQSYSFTTGTSHNKPVAIKNPFGGYGSTINPLAPDSAHSFVKIVADTLCFGPRLMTAAIRLLGGAWRFSKLDVEGCAAVLGFLAGKDGRTVLPEVITAVPPGHDPAAVLKQLHQLDGVLVLKSEPPGLSLTTDLRAELRRVGQARPHGRTGPRKSP